MKILLTDVFNLLNRGERLVVQSIVKDKKQSYGLLSFYAILDQSFLKKHQVKVIGKTEFESLPYLVPFLVKQFLSGLLYRLCKRTFLLTDLLKEVKQYHLAIDLGGETFQDHFSLWGVLQHCYTLQLLQFVGVEYFLFSQSLHFKSNLIWKVAGRYIRSALMITVRNTESFMFLLGKGVTSFYFPDVVFSQMKLKRVKRSSPLRIGINVSPLVVKSWKVWGPLIEKLVNENYQVTLIPHVLYDKKRDDREILFKIYMELPESTRRLVSIYLKYDFQEIERLIQSSHIFVGSRMHSVISAMGSGVPSILIGYNEKQFSLQRMLSPNLFVVSYDDPELAEHLFQRIQKLDMFYFQYLRDIFQCLKDIKKESNGHFEVLSSLCEF